MAAGICSSFFLLPLADISLLREKLINLVGKPDMEGRRRRIAANPAADVVALVILISVQDLNQSLATAPLLM
jgi:hypothetical protein